MKSKIFFQWTDYRYANTDLIESPVVSVSAVDLIIIFESTPLL